MTNSFAKQTHSIPLSLVQQGWRREPSRDVMLAWDDRRISNPDRLQRWTMIFIRDVDGTSIDIWRPEVIGKYHDATAVYAHKGWGDGLMPTPEMLNTWKWWWVGDDIVHIMHVEHSWNKANSAGPVIPASHP